MKGNSLEGWMKLLNAELFPKQAYPWLAEDATIDYSRKSGILPETSKVSFLILEKIGEGYVWWHEMIDTLSCKAD